MRILKKILLVLIILVVAVAVIGFAFFPSHIHVERSINVNQKPSVVYSYLSSFKNFNDWSPWFKKDPAAKITYEGPESGVGAMMKWDSEHDQVGWGSMTVKETIPDSLIRTELRFMEGSPAFGSYTLSRVDEGTRITWALDAEAGMNPFMRIMGKFMDGMVGKDFDAGLADLKTQVEGISQSANITVEDTVLTDMHYMAVRDSGNFMTISDKLGAAYGMITTAAQQQGLQMTGMPFAIYYTSSDTAWVFDAGIPFNKAGKASGNVKPGMIKSGNAVVAHYFGAYEGTGQAHKAVDEYIQKNNKTVTGPPIEMYVTDPGAEPDTSKWQTDVIYPVQ